LEALGGVGEERDEWVDVSTAPLGRSAMIGD
jgi:hypothetical protein